MNNKKRAAELIHSVYGSDVGDPLLERIWAMLPDRENASAVERNDCMLITYANSIVAESEVPLRSLKRFLDTHVGSVFGRLHVLPFFPWSSDDGFSVIDYRMVDHQYGSWADIEALERDYDLMFDLVINHCSRESLWFADFVSGRDPGRHYFITLLEGSDVSSVARPRSTPLISAVHTYSGIRHVWNTFSSDQVDLDFGNPDVLCEFVDILFFYIARGARLIRLDAIGYLWKRLGTGCLNLPETHALVKLFRVLVDEAAPGVQLITETNVPHEQNVSYFGASDEAHMVYQFSLAPLLLYSYVFGDSTYLTSWAQRLEDPPPGATFLNFFASHDGIGLRPLEGVIPEANVDQLVERMHAKGGFVTTREVNGAQQRPYEINISLMSALGGSDGMAAFLGAHALLLSFRGSPAFYIHSLLGTMNDLDLVEQTGRTRSINRRMWSMHDLQRELDNPGSIQSRALAGTKQLVARRNQQPALLPDADQRVLPATPGIFAMYRTCPTQTLLVVASVVAQPQRISVGQLDLPAGQYADALTGRTVTVSDRLELGPYEVVWLDLGR